jgi:hypothetical protein
MSAFLGSVFFIFTAMKTRSAFLARFNPRQKSTLRTMLLTGEHVENRQNNAEEIFAIGQIVDQFVEFIGQAAQSPVGHRSKNEVADLEPCKISTKVSLLFA